MKISKKQVAMLLQEAGLASSRAYAPYSRYRVGAALMTDKATVYTGCNVENASYGLTVCAERVALQNAVSSGAKKFMAIAIVAAGTRTPPVPCGACRQVLMEFCKPSMPVIVAGGSGNKKYSIYKLGDLLPRSFKLR